MKRLIKSTRYLPVIGMLFILGFYGCTKDDDDTRVCRSYDWDYADYRSFEISVTCVDTDGEPWVGSEVCFEFYKEYCDGTISGEQTHTNITNIDGKTFSPYTPEFKYVNSLDKVYVNVYMKIGFNQYSELYGWRDVDDLDTEYIVDLAGRKKVIKHFDIVE